MPETLALKEQDAVSHQAAAEAAAYAVQECVVIHESTESRLTPFQAEVLALTSLGQTANQTARQLEAPAEDVKAAKEQAKLAYGTRSIGAAVSKAIQEGGIGIEVRPDPDILMELSSFDTSILYFYAAGGNNEQIARDQNVSFKAINVYRDHLFKKIKAWSAPHAVRRAYELGIIQRKSKEVS